MQVVKVTNSEITLSATANNIYSSKLVRITNGNTTTKHTITIQTAGGNTISTFTLAPFDVIAVVKNSTDAVKVDAGTDCGASPITFIY